MIHTALLVWPALRPGQRDRRRRRGERFGLFDAGLPRAEFLGGLRSWARSSASSETTPGSLRVTNRSASLPLSLIRKLSFLPAVAREKQTIGTRHPKTKRLEC